MSTLSALKSKVLKLINKSGYDLTKIETEGLDFPIIKEDMYNPEKIIFFAKLNKLPFLCYVPPKHLQGHVMNFNFDDENHPFKKAVLNAIKENKKKKAIKNSLEGFYEETTPSNAAEVLGLKDKDLPVLSEKEPWLAVHPWENRTLEEVKKKRPNQTNRENKKNGKDISIDEGWHLFGPVSEDKLEVEAKRVFEVLKKVQKDGYKAYNNYNNISTTILIDHEKDKMKWVVYDGQHRTSVLSALNYKKIPVLVKSIVSRSDVEFWPGVENGDFSKEAALKIFDRVINEKPSY